MGKVIFTTENHERGQMFQNPMSGVASHGRGAAYSNFNGDGWFYTGDDWNGNSSGAGDWDIGAPVRAAGNGVVAFAGDYGGEWGRVVIIEHKTADGVVFASTTYARLNAIEVTVGSTVTKGEVIGGIGTVGIDELNPHLFYSIHAGALAPPGVQFAPDLEAAGYLNPTNYTASERNGIVAYGRDIDDVGNSALFGYNSPDCLVGLGGNDWLEASNGNDFLDGGTGNDTMLGGPEDDVYVVDSIDDIVEEGTTLGSSIDEGGTDTVRSSVNWTLAGDFVENLVLTGAAASIGTGNGLANIVIGNEAGNTLEGRDGSDRLNGLGGSDTVYGGQGDDTLGGGAGTDALVGGEGADVYFFDTALSAANVDLLVGFDAAVDMIYLDHTVFSQLGPEGPLSSDEFDITGDLSLSPHIHFDAEAQKLYFDPGSSSPEIQIASFDRLVGTLTHENFRIV